MSLEFTRFVIPAKAGIQSGAATPVNWIPAFAGMTMGDAE